MRSGGEVPYDGFMLYIPGAVIASLCRESTLPTISGGRPAKRDSLWLSRLEMYFTCMVGCETLKVIGWCTTSNTSQPLSLNRKRKEDGPMSSAMA
jgi:hypothetical protein